MTVGEMSAGRELRTDLASGEAVDELAAILDEGLAVVGTPLELAMMVLDRWALQALEGTD